MVEALGSTLLDVSVLAFGTATKTKPILAKPINVLLNDEKVMNRFLLATLEGTQMLKANSMVCLGGDNDVWQQTVEKLHKQYTPVSVDEEGWTTFQPKPENERDVHEVTPDDTGDDLLFPESGGPTKFSIKAQWGDRQADGSSLQYGQVGDFILRSKEDPTDVWIVARKVFLATYDMK